MQKVIYIAGPMKFDPDYKTKFDAAESYLTWKGWTVLNPAWLPEGLKPDEYMPICLAMLNAADAIVSLKGSSESDGAKLELRYAEYQGKKTYSGIEQVPVLVDEPVDNSVDETVDG